MTSAQYEQDFLLVFEIGYVRQNRNPFERKQQTYPENLPAAWNKSRTFQHKTVVINRSSVNDDNSQIIVQRFSCVMERKSQPSTCDQSFMPLTFSQLSGVPSDRIQIIKLENAAPIDSNVSTTTTTRKIELLPSS